MSGVNAPKPVMILAPVSSTTGALAQRHGWKWQYYQNATILSMAALFTAGLYFKQEVPAAECSDQPFWREVGAEPARCADGACCQASSIRGIW